MSTNGPFSLNFDARNVTPLSPYGQDATLNIQNTNIIKTSAEFVAGFVPPDYLIDRVLQRRFIYSNTAPTGEGKTAVTLTIAVAVAMGWPVGEHEVEQGRVLYFAGENPDDIRMRWIMMAEHFTFNPHTISVYFVEGTFSIPLMEWRIKQEIEAKGEFSLIIVDTSAAYFQGDNENDNAQMGNHARSLRRLTTMPGRPCVIVNCHPVKAFNPDNLLPRGGGAFIAELDGNLTCSNLSGVVKVHWQGKFRGPDFPPIPFALRTVTTPNLIDAKGRVIPTVIAAPITDAEQSTIETQSHHDENQVLILLDKQPKMSMADIAEACGWKSSNGKPAKSKVFRIIDRLRKEKLVVRERGGQNTLTDKGRGEVRKAPKPNTAGNRAIP